MGCLLILLYVFAIAIRQLSVGSDVGGSHFATVPESRYTLLIDGSFMDNLGTLVRNVGQQSLVCGVIFLLFVLMPHAQ